MSGKNVIYIGGFEMPDKNAAAHRVLNNSKILNELGYHVVFCGIDKQKRNTQVIATKMGPFDNVPAKYPKTKIEWFKELFSSKHIIDVLDLYDDIAFVIAYNMHAQPLKNLMKYCRKRNIKIIADATEWYNNPFSLLPTKFIKWLDTFFVMKFLQKKVDGMISISSLLFNYYKKSVSPIIQLPPLVDLDDAIWKQEVATREECVEFIYSGVPGKDKDKINYIIDAFYRIQKHDFVFTIIGIEKKDFLDCYPDRKNILEALAGKVVFAGRVTHSESIKALLKADYCIFVRENTLKNNAGFPTKFAECVSAGIGVIANDVSDLKNYFPLKDSWIIQDTNPSKIEEKIIAAIYNGKVKHLKNDTFHYKNYLNLVGSFLDDLGGNRMHG